MNPKNVPFFCVFFNPGTLSASIPAAPHSFVNRLPGIRPTKNRKLNHPAGKFFRPAGDCQFYITALDQRDFIELDRVISVVFGLINNSLEGFAVQRYLYPLYALFRPIP